MSYIIVFGLGVFLGYKYIQVNDIRAIKKKIRDMLDDKDKNN